MDYNIHSKMPLHQQLICWSKSNENPIMPPGNNSCSFVTWVWAATCPEACNSFPSVRKNIIKGLRVARIQKNSYCISLIKRWFEMKSTKLYSKMLFVKSSENNLIFLPAFYLIMCHLCVAIFQFFSYKIEKETGKEKNCVLCCSFWSNRDLDKLGTLKWPSKPQFYERY